MKVLILMIKIIVIIIIITITTLPVSSSSSDQIWNKIFTNTNTTYVNHAHWKKEDAKQAARWLSCIGNAGLERMVKYFISYATTR